MNYAKHFAKPPTQRQQARGEVANNAGGFTFPVDDWTRLGRFLVLGSEGGSYYVGERKLTRDSAKVVERLLKVNGPEVVNKVVEISTEARAPKNDPALFALAMCLKLGDSETRAVAKAAVPMVARTGTHLFHLAEYVKAFGGWGRGTQAAFASWYNSLAPGQLAYQAVKYQQRDGWSHRDLLRKIHLVPTPEKAGVLSWMVKGWPGVGPQPHPDKDLQLIWAFEKAKAARGKELVKLITDYRLPHECVPNEAKGDPAVWEAMLPSMGVTALIRNLGKMTSIGLIKPLSDATRAVREKLEDVELIRKGKVHPLQILVAQRVYGQGHGDKGSLKWTPEMRVIDALNKAFYASFKAVEPTGKRTLLALDVSGSMGSPDIAGMPGVTPRIGAAAMALVTANVEKEHGFIGFTAGGTGFYSGGRTLYGSGGVSVLQISPQQRLQEVVDYTAKLPFGGTDCSLPMLWATANKIPVDVFCVYTDSETWAGNVKPVTALQQYRQKMGIGAKLVVVGMVANEFTIADPTDAGMLDVVGFDTATPSILADFARE